jgi:hypothetical protein
VGVQTVCLHAYIVLVALQKSEVRVKPSMNRQMISCLEAQMALADEVRCGEGHAPQQRKWLNTYIHGYRTCIKRVI